MNAILFFSAAFLGGSVQHRGGRDGIRRLCFTTAESLIRFVRPAGEAGGRAIE